MRLLILLLLPACSIMFDPADPESRLVGDGGVLIDGDGSPILDGDGSPIYLADAGDPVPDARADAAPFDPAAACTACQAAGGFCNVGDGMCQFLGLGGTNKFDSQTLACPAGLQCVVQCDNDNCAAMTVACPPDAPCSVQCQTATACENATVDCSDSCACDVTCVGCGNVDCPIGGVCAGTRSCTSTPTATCNACGG